MHARGNTIVNKGYTPYMYAWLFIYSFILLNLQRISVALLTGTHQGPSAGVVGVKTRGKLISKENF